jgi:hypothetical protein
VKKALSKIGGYLAPQSVSSLDYAFHYLIEKHKGRAGIAHLLLQALGADEHLVAFAMQHEILIPMYLSNAKRSCQWHLSERFAGKKYRRELAPVGTGPFHPDFTSLLSLAASLLCKTGLVSVPGKWTSQPSGFRRPTFSLSPE